jgi:hypothetical protein
MASESDPEGSANIPEWMDVDIINGMYGSGSWHELFDYGGIRYNSLLRSTHDGLGVQDELLELLAKACEEDDDDGMDDYGDECRKLIWPLIKQDYESRTEIELKTLSSSKAEVSIEGRTVDGELRAFPHTQKFPNFYKPISNTFPNLPAFPHSLVRRVDRLDEEIFQVEYDGRQYCLKTVLAKAGDFGLKREITTLQRCQHPHIIPIRGVVVNDNNKVEGMLLELIPNSITLDSHDFTHFTKAQCSVWASQIRSAVRYLHDKSLVWGDAKPANILVRPNDDLVLIDFGGGATEGWVDFKKIDTIEGDIEALERIEQFLQGKVVDVESSN